MNEAMVEEAKSKAINALSELEISKLLGLEKQDEQKPTLPKWKYKKDHTPLLRDSIILNKYGCVAKSPSGSIISDAWVLDYDELAKLPKEELEKQGEQKPTKEVKSKFKVGDWVILTAGELSTMLQIINVDTNKKLYWFNDSTYLPIVDEECLYLWTIQDAEDGDVLCSKKHNLIWIYKDNKHYYASINFNYADVVSFDNEIIIPSDACPANRVQKSILFQKMEEAGYKWDADKKELKKIEQKFKVGNWYQCIKDVFGKGITFDKNTAYYCVKEGCLQNEYGCHIAIDKDLYDNFKLWTIKDVKDGDVISDGEIIVIFKYFEDPSYRQRIVVYIGLDTSGDIQITDFTWYLCIDKVKPATKEQRDTLMKAMPDVRYERDTEKKEIN